VLKETKEEKRGEKRRGISVKLLIERYQNMFQ
jgi:hypothetical protein